MKTRQLCTCDAPVDQCRCRSVATANVEMRDPYGLEPVITDSERLEWLIAEGYVSDLRCLGGDQWDFDAYDAATDEEVIFEGKSWRAAIDAAIVGCRPPRRTA